MFIALGFVTVVFMFYKSAKDAQKSTFLWVMLAITLFFVLGYTFLQITDNYILHIKTLADTQTNTVPRMLLSAVSAIIIITVSYIIQDKFLPKKK